MLQDDGKVHFDTNKYLEILKKDLRLVTVKFANMSKGAKV